MSEPEVTLRINELDLSLLPEEHVDFFTFAVQVVRRPGDRWVVLLRRTLLLYRDGTWHHGFGPEVEQNAYFGYDEALTLARKALPHIKVGGKSALDLLRDGEVQP